VVADEVAIVTGGSRGIGRATALALAASGYRVCVGFVSNHQAASAVVTEIEAKGGSAIAAKCNVASELDILALFKVADAFGPLGALVNSAGVVDVTARVDEMSAGRMQRMMHINVIGSMLCAREAVKRMSTKHGGPGGAIVNISSRAAQLGSPGEYVDYAASKGAIDTFTIGLAQEVAQEGIRVNGVRPGFIYTDIHASGGEPNRVERVKAFVPMRRGGTAEETAAAIIWLLSDEASFTTGAFIDVSGGR
jgi:NAD(P)-dependent dehydrogenase (short-subunit alcohol dehydrogenase family)